jgi:hypothetical protein
MKHPFGPLLGLLILLLGGCSSQDNASSTPPPLAAQSAALTPTPVPDQDPDSWPRALQVDNTIYTIYQPQLDRWDAVTLDARAAVAVQPKGATQPTYGIIFLEADTTIDREERQVKFENVRVTRTQFPSLTEAEPYRERFQSFIPKDLKSMDLDRLEASLAVVEAMAKSPKLLNTPPAFVFATQPTSVIPVDGAPRWVVADTTGLQRVINTRALLLRDTSGVIYLHFYDGFVKATSLDGPWTVVTTVPDPIVQLTEQLVVAKQVDLLAGQPDPETQMPPTLVGNGVPALLVTTAPTELIVTEGPAKWTPIPDTQLSFIENTPGHVFKHLTDQQTYVLVSGRWFRAPGEQGPWEFVPGKSLPKDFAGIPDSSPKENVKASVPGTRQAAEAVIANIIPTTTKMDRKTAKLDPAPAYDGGVPVLKPIEETPLHYAANSSTPVIRVDEQTWFACHNGVWFSAAAPAGPWVIADNVPTAIYTIPASSPLYYVTYVRVYRADADHVWVGYTPGYYGTVISEDGTVVYGTGYVYEPYVTETIYVAYPSTYGYSSSMTWTPWAGWGFGFTIGYCWGASWAYWGCMPPAPYWGPYWGYCYGWGYNAAGGITAWGPYGWAGTSGNIYSQNGPWSGVSRYAAGANAWTGNRWATQYGRAYNSTTGTRAIGSRGAIHNVYSGNYAFGARGAAYNERSGNAAWGSRTTFGNAYNGNQYTRTSGGFYNQDTGEVTRVGRTQGEHGSIGHVGDDVYAGHDGNVYKRTDTGWEQVGGNRPQPTTGNRDSAGSAGASTHDYSTLNREYNARSVGTQRANSYHTSRPAFRGGGGRRR